MRRWQGGADAGLQNAIACGDALFGGVKACPVQRMGNFAYHLCDRAAQQPGVSVQRNDIADILRQNAADDFKTGIAGTAQQTVQLDQLAALAFPPHPDAFGRIPQSAAM